MADGKKKGSTTRKPARPAKKAPAAAAPVPAAVAGHPEFELKNETVEQALQTGEHAGFLEDYFGPEGYAELRQLSREAASRGVRGGPRVLILPGIMGSEIGTRRSLPPFNDVYWFDPVDVATGQLSHLALPSARKLEAVGVILLAYLKLKLRLQIGGYDVDFYPYDWRLSIADLSKALAARLKEEGKEVSLVAHSMGGLVARAAIAKAGAESFHRLIMLGTPNFGSFVPVQAFRATYPTVLKVAELDRVHDAKQLAGDVFATFPGLTQLLPSPERFSKVDLYDLAMWPPGNDKLRPRKEILAKVKEVQKGLAPASDRFFLIAGVNQETVVGLRRKDDGQFDYELSRAGDGTVPLDFALLPGAKTYYIEESHGSLPNNKRVAQAVMDLLAGDKTGVLPDTAPASRAAVRVVPEAELRVPPYGTRRDGALSQRELRHVLDEVASPTAREESLPSAPSPVGRPVVAIPGNLSGAEAGYRHRFERVVVGRRRQHRIDLRFALGSITEADTRALVLGIFRDVKPGGAAAALDERLDGAITEMSHRRMFSGNVGEIFMLPTGRYPVTADLIAFVGLGPFDRFNDEVLQTAAENVIRTFVRTRVEEFATVLFGGSSGETPAGALRNLLIGFFRGLCDADRDHQFRRIVVCENNADRYVAIKEELYRLSSTSLCQDVEITFDEEVLRQPPILEPSRRALLMPRRDPTYLIVRAEQQGQQGSDSTGLFDIRSAVLTAGGKATVVTGVVPAVTVEKIDEQVAALDREMQMDLQKTGSALAELVLSQEVRTILERQRDRHLVVVHDATLSRVPWETIAFKLDEQGAPPPTGEEITFPAGPQVWFPAAEKGLSRRYAADNLSVAKWLQERVQDEVLRVLLVVNPTLDLQGAEDEGKIVHDMLAQLPGVRLDELKGKDATFPALLSAFSSGRYDVIHYAGHAFFDPINPERSGLLCNGRTRLTGADLAGLANLPTMVFFNACESARSRDANAAQEPQKDLRDQVRDTVSFAEAFLRGGIANFIGTYWPVGDDPAKVFADTFYRNVLQGRTLGESLQAGRQAIRKETRSKDWADYVFYGNPDFILKEGLAAERLARQP